MYVCQSTSLMNLSPKARVDAGALALARPHGRGVETQTTKLKKIRTNHRARCGVAARRSPTASRRKGQGGSGGGRANTPSPI